MQLITTHHAAKFTTTMIGCSKNSIIHVATIEHIAKKQTNSLNPDMINHSYKLAT